MPTTAWLGPPYLGATAGMTCSTSSTADLEAIARQPLLEDDQHPDAGPGGTRATGEETGPQLAHSLRLKDLTAAQSLGPQALLTEAPQMIAQPHVEGEGESLLG